MPRRGHNHETAAVASGTFRVDSDGGIWRVRRCGMACVPHRADGVQKDGYRAVHLRIDGRRVRVLAHRLVYVARFGPIPEGWVVRHRDRDRAENHPANLYLARPVGLFAVSG